MLLAPLSLLPLLAAPAHAEEHGLVVRLEMPGEPVPTAAFVVLKPATGEVTRIEVKDNGTPPDVTASDLSYSGAMWLEGDSFEVSIEIDGKPIPGGPASWGADDAARDLVVTYSGGSVTIEAGVSGGAGVGNDPPPPNGADAAGTPSSAGTPPSGGTTMPPVGNGPTGPGFATNTAETGKGSLYVAFGLGLIGLVGLAWLWLRNRPGESAGPVAGLALVAEPGLLGPGSPSLSDGLQLWIVPEADAAALLKPLLATLARHHRVLVVAPAATNVPGVYGGPVYRSTNLRPSHVGDAADSLQREGSVVTALLFGTQGDAASVKDYADLLPTGVGGICVVSADPGVPALARVTARRDGPVWVVQTPETTLRLVETATGFAEEAAR